MSKWVTLSAVGAMFLMGLFLASKSEAIPVFARKYETSCSTCHYAFGRLNSFGRAFRNQGFRYPGDDKAMAKQDPVSLGAESQKKVFPNSIWPSDIPGSVPVSLRWTSLWQYDPKSKGHEFTFENPSAISALSAGTMGDNLSFFLELNWEGAGAFSYGGRIDYKFCDQFHARVGNIDFLPVLDLETLTPVEYNFGPIADLDGSGIEFWGAANGPGSRGGLLYSAGIINGENDGHENIDLNSNKDVFVKASYKIGGMGVLGSTTATSTVEYWRDNSITVGAFGSIGRNSNASDNRNIGFNTDIFYQDLNVFGLAMLEQTTANDSVGFARSVMAFTEADYVVYPWLIPLVRFQYSKPAGEEAVREIIPAVVVLARANVKVVPTARIDLNKSENNRVLIQFDIGL